MSSQDWAASEPRLQVKDPRRVITRSVLDLTAQWKASHTAWMEKPISFKGFTDDKETKTLVLMKYRVRRRMS